MTFGPIKPYRSIGPLEIRAALAAMDEPLSGYLAGKSRGGKLVQALETLWCETFHVKHAVACNSATSALMAAAFAIELKQGDHFTCPAMTMSATVAAPMFTGAEPHFVDVEPDTFGLSGAASWGSKAVFITNLFGHPAHLKEWRRACDDTGTYLIEDNAQSPFATENGRYAGTIGHIGCWSLNVHKHFQCGEGGVATTNDDALAEKLRAFINHGENVTDRIGLNLRMPEVSAAIALSQLRRGRHLVENRVEQAEAILYAIGDLPGIRPPVVREGCTHVYYTIPFVMAERAAIRRAYFCDELREAGVPVVEGYVEPLYRLPAFEYCRRGQIAAHLNDEQLFYIENCAYDFTPDQIKKIGEAFKRAWELLNAQTARCL